MTNTSYGQFLKKKREAMDLSHQELTKLAGVGHGTVTMIERDSYLPSLEIRRKLELASA